MRAARPVAKLSISAAGVAAGGTTRVLVGGVPVTRQPHRRRRSPRRICVCPRWAPLPCTVRSCMSAAHPLLHDGSTWRVRQRRLYVWAQRQQHVPIAPLHQPAALHDPAQGSTLQSSFLVTLHLVTVSLVTGHNRVATLPPPRQEHPHQRDDCPLLAQHDALRPRSHPSVHALSLRFRCEIRRRRPRIPAQSASATLAHPPDRRGPSISPWAAQLPASR